MSAKQFYKPKIYDASVLPNEIWEEIIRWATWVDGFPDIKLQTLHTRSSSDKALQKELRASLVTKRYIVRVCRQWHTLALPYFYEYILLGLRRTVKPLLASFRASAAKYDQPFGWWTKRLDVLLRDDPPPHQPDTVFPDLSDFMKELPNLMIWNLYFRDATSPIPLLLGANCCGHSLQVVNFYSHANDQRMLEGWETFLVQHPNIRYLASNPANPINLPDMPHLASIWNPWTYKIDHNSLISRYPDLHTVILDIPLVSKIPLMPDALDQISHLQLVVSDAYMISGNLEPLQSIFRSLERLDFVFVSAFPSHGFRFYGCPASAYVGFRSTMHTTRKAGWRFFVAIIPGLFAANPSLKRLQFTDKADVDSLQRYRVHRKFMRPLMDLQDMGIEVLDDEGSRLYY